MTEIPTRPTSLQFFFDPQFDLVNVISNFFVWMNLRKLSNNPDTSTKVPCLFQFLDSTPQLYLFPLVDNEQLNTVFLDKFQLSWGSNRRSSFTCRFELTYIIWTLLYIDSTGICVLTSSACNKRTLLIFPYLPYILRILSKYMIQYSSSMSRWCEEYEFESLNCSHS